MKASLNHIFRTIWSEALGTWVAVSELTPSKGKSGSCVLNAAELADGKNNAGNLDKPNCRLRFKPLAITLACCFSFGAQANPIDAQVVNGTASISQSGSVLTITNSPNAIINWQSFSINAGETTRFIQESASSSVLNRVLGADPSRLLGTLTSNGRVFLINPAGILVGQGARIDVPGFVASTLPITNADFLAGRLNFSSSPFTPIAGTIQNNGTITTPEGGSVYLIAPQVENNGIISTPKGETILAAGNTVQLMDTGTPGVTVQVTGSGNAATNLGQILADSGRIGMVGAVVRNSGTINASSLVSQGGKIFLRASNRVEAGGTITANGTTGGAIEVLGKETGVMDGATLSANGAQGGGTVLIGGDYQGKNPVVQNAQVTYVASTASISADATANGNGGKVIVWADDTTRAYGNISVRGGASGGNGGFIETSGHRYLDVNGITVNAGAGNGKKGTWLLDPVDITIVHDADMGNAGGNPVTYAPGSTGSLFSDGTINGALANADVLIQTSGGAGGIGDITFDSAYNGGIIISNSFAGARTLNLNADHNIIFSGGVTTFQAPPSTATLDIGLNVGNKVITASGAGVTLNGGSGYGLTRAWVAPGKTWENSGSLIVDTNAAVHLEHNYGPGTASTFHNMTTGVVDVSGTTGWAFWSNSCCQDGIITNDGVFNILGSTSFEAAYSQSSTGTLNIVDTKFLNLQNAIALSGTVNLNATGTLNLNENHGTAASLNNLTFSGTGGTLNISATKTANLSNVSAANVALTVATNGIINLVNGNATFKTMGLLTGGTLGAMTNGILGIASGNFIVPTGVVYTGNVGYSTTTGSLTIGTNISTTGNISLTSGAGISITDAQVQSGGNMTVNVGTDLSLTAATAWTALKSGGTQTINFTGAGAHLMTLAGSTTANVGNAGASVESTGLQAITNAGTLGITLTGGTATAAAPSNAYVYVNGVQTATLICTACATWDGAGIRSEGGQTINATTISVTGGSGGNGNNANIENRSTTVAQTITTTGAITVTGGTGAGYYNAATPNDSVSNDAGIHSDGTQTISAGSINILGGGDSTTLGGAFLTGKLGQDITTAGNMVVTGGASAAAGQYGLGAAAIIGEQLGANIALHIGGNLTMTGGSGTTSAALIGSATGTPNITITAGSGIFMLDGAGASSKIGVLTGGPAGTLSLTATTGNITQNAASKINTASLIASASAGSINLAGANLINTITSLVASANVSYASAQATHIGSAISTGGGTVSLSTTGAGNNLYLGTASGAVVNATVAGGIYDDNGTGITNITATTSSTLISTGATLGDLGVSADVNTPSITATVSGNYGGISIRSTGASAPTTIALTDSATVTPQGVSFYHEGATPFTLGAGMSFLAGSGDIFIGGIDVMTYAGGSTITSTGNTLLGAGNVLNVGANMSVGGSLALVAGTSLNIGGNVSAGAGDLTLLAPTVNITGGTASASQNAYVKTGDLTVTDGSVSATVDTWVAATGDVRLNATTSASILAGRDVTLTLAGPASTLYFNAPTAGNLYTGTAKVQSGAANLPATVYLDFLGRSSGGVLIDGVGTLATAAVGSATASGFYNAGTPAVDGAGLQVTYLQQNLGNLLATIAPPPAPPPDPVVVVVIPPPPVDAGGAMPGTLDPSGGTVGGTADTFGGTDTGTTEGSSGEKSGNADDKENETSGDGKPKEDDNKGKSNAKPEKC